MHVVNLPIQEFTAEYGLEIGYLLYTNKGLIIIGNATENYSPKENESKSGAELGEFNWQEDHDLIVHSYLDLKKQVGIQTMTYSQFKE